MPIIMPLTSESNGRKPLPTWIMRLKGQIDDRDYYTRTDIAYMAKIHVRNVIKTFYRFIDPDAFVQVNGYGPREAVYYKKTLKQLVRDYENGKKWRPYLTAEDRSKIDSERKLILKKRKAEREEIFHEIDQYKNRIKEDQEKAISEIMRQKDEYEKALQKLNKKILALKNIISHDEAESLKAILSDEKDLPKKRVKKSRSIKAKSSKKKSKG